MSPVGRHSTGIAATTKADRRSQASVTRRGPTRSTQVPKWAAESPSITIAIEKITPTAVRLVSKCATRAVL